MQIVDAEPPQGLRHIASGLDRQPLHRAVHDARDDGEKQLVLAGKIFVQRSLGAADDPDDIVHRRPRKTLVEKHRRRGGDDLVLSGLGLGRSGWVHTCSLSEDD